MSETIELLGVSGLLLPGSPERPCPWVIDTVAKLAAKEPITYDDMLRIAAAWAWWRLQMLKEAKTGDGMTEAEGQEHDWYDVYREAERRINAK